MSEEQARRIRQQDAELVGIGRCCAAIVRDLKAAGHADAAKRFEEQVEASRWTIQEVLRKWDEVGAYNAAAENALRRIATACGFDRTHDYPLQIVGDVEQRLAERDSARRMWAEAVEAERGGFPERRLYVASVWGRAEALRLYPDDHVRKLATSVYCYDEDELDVAVTRWRAAFDERHPPTRVMPEPPPGMQDRIARNLFGDDVVDEAKQGAAQR